MRSHFFRRLMRSSSQAKIGNKRASAAGKMLIPSNLSETLHTIRTSCGGSTDVVIREIEIAQQESEVNAAIVYLDGLADASAILESLLVDGKETRALERENSRQLMEQFRKSLLKTGDVKEILDMDGIHDAIFSGDTVILVDGHSSAIVAGTREAPERAVSEPQSQTVIRGPRDGFAESLRTNTALVRRKIKNPDLWLETRQIGRVTKTDVAIMFIKGIANDKVVQEVRSRLERIDTDAILESGYIEEFIQDDTFSPFPTVFNTERPDVVAAGLLEGRVAIFVDGTPFVLLAPALFTQFLQTPEDYYQRADIGTLIRLLRFVALFIALLAPSIYIAVTTYHQEMIPTPLLINILAQREGIPFPAFIEAALMEITFEILREAGVRMPRAVGQAVSIVGALVIGQAAVEAGFVGPSMVIIVSITAISNFVIPSYNLGIAVRMIRFMLMILAASFGHFGILVGVIAIVLHLCSLRSFGIPYMSPFAPVIAEDQKDNLLRLPHWLLNARPRLISQINVQREQQPAHRDKKPE